MSENKVINKVKKIRLVRLTVSLARHNSYIKKIENYLNDSMPYKPSKKQIRWCYYDFLKFQWKYKGSLETDYLGTQLFRKSDFVRRESFATNVRFSWRRAVQNPNDWPVFNDKRLFYQEYSDFLGRDWMIVDGGVTYDAFLAFIHKCNSTLIVKHPVSFGGKDVSEISIHSESEARDLYERFRKTPTLIEGKLKQCNEIASLSTSSVNTFRIITIVDEQGVPHVARAVIRIGRGDAVIDNYSSGGMAAQVDVSTGIVFTTAQDKKGHSYIVHPDTKKQIVGFQIPEWEGYKKFAIQLASMNPGMRYVGWDIIKDNKGDFCVIEGNEGAGADVMESPLLYGLLPLYNSVLKTGKVF